MTAAMDAREHMNAMYRFTRHVYDLSRKYYLLGRDCLIQNLNAKPGENICEVGCGTARNLVKMQKIYPQSGFFGIDASDEMLKTADQNIGRLDIGLAQGYAQNFSAQDLFGISKFDKIVFSYSLSIIPPWNESIDHALTLTKEIHIVDFGGMEQLPPWFAKFLFGWLKLFHVYHKPEILGYLQKLQKQGKGTLEITYLYKGYAYLAKFVAA